MKPKPPPTSRRGSLLCYSIGSSHYNDLAAFLGPNKPIKNLPYNDLVDQFKSMLIPLRSEVISQHYFLSVTQQEKQAVAKFVAALRKGISECNFIVKKECECGKENAISVADLFLRAQFIRKIRDAWLREQLLQSTEADFDQLVAKAIAIEASRLESRELGGKPNCSFDTTTPANRINRPTKNRINSALSITISGTSNIIQAVTVTTIILDVTAIILTLATIIQVN